MQSERGFTLIELGIVFAIIGVLAAVAGPNLTGLRNNMASREASLQARVLMRRAQTLAGAKQKMHMVAVRQRSATANPDYVTLFEMNANDTVFKSSSLSNAQLAGTAAAPTGVTFVERVNMPARIGLGPAAGSSAYITLPYPFTAFPLNKACTFCSGIDGAVFFSPDGQAKFSDGNAEIAARSGSITISPQAEWSKTTKSTIYSLTIQASNGGVRVWLPRQ